MLLFKFMILPKENSEAYLTNSIPQQKHKISI